MSKTIIFKDEYETILKRLKIKTRFVNNIKAQVNRYNKEIIEDHYVVFNHKTKCWNFIVTRNLKEKLDFLNTHCEQWETFIGSAFDWNKTLEGCRFWYKVAFDFNRG